MSKTWKHKDKAKFKNKILKYSDICDSTKYMFERHNSDISEDKENFFRVQEKILKNELKLELKSFITLT